jgi:hypothetical protein
MMKQWLTAAAILALLTGSAPAARAQERVIGHCDTRHFRVTLIATSKGLRYTVADRQGRQKAVRLTADQLSSRYPDVYRNIRNATAARSKGFVWAGL